MKKYQLGFGGKVHELAWEDTLNISELSHKLVDLHADDSSRKLQKSKETLNQLQMSLTSVKVTYGSTI